MLIHIFFFLRYKKKRFKFPIININVDYTSCNFYYDGDLDFKKFIDLIVSLNLSFNKKNDQDHFIKEIERDGFLKFEIYINILSHIASRDGQLNHVFRNGIKKLYEHIISKSRLDEEALVTALKTTLEPGFILQRDDLDPTIRTWWDEMYGFCNHMSCEHKSCTLALCKVRILKRPCNHKRYCTSAPSKYVLRVPWQRALEMMREKTFLIEQQYVYFTYHDIPLLMLCLWDYKVKLWQADDMERVLVPMLEHLDKTILNLAPRVPPTERIHKQMRFYREFAIFPSKEYMKLERYCDPAESAISFFYQSALQVILNMKETPVRHNPLQQKIQYVAEYTPDSTDFDSTYMKLLPPCIYRILRNHFANRTHPKNNERVLIFRFLIAAKIPLEAAQVMWTKIIDNANDTRGQRHQLMACPQDLYNSFASPNSPQRSFNSCDTIQSTYNACPFSDIEDLGNRKNHCAQNNLWIERLKQPSLKKAPWPRRRGIWSPIIAYNSLIEFHSKKKL